MPARPLAIASFLTDEDGLEAVEWLLVLAGAVIPIMVLVFIVMNAVGTYYSYVSWTVSLPFP